MWLIRLFLQANWRRYCLKILVFFFVFFTLSCNKQLPPNPNIYVNEEHLNSEITINVPEDANTFLLDDSMVYLMINNYHSEVVTFPNDFGVQAYMLEGDRWKRIETIPVEYFNYETEEVEGEINTSKVVNEEPIIGNHEINPKSTKTAGVVPVTPKENPVYLRIFVIGSMGEGASIIRVAAYTDILLRPVVD